MTKIETPYNILYSFAYYNPKMVERLVSDIVNDIADVLGSENPPLGIALYMEGEHLCKTMRGAKKQGRMSCCYLTGVFKEDQQARNEFLNATKQ